MADTYSGIAMERSVSEEWSSWILNVMDRSHLIFGTWTFRPPQGVNWTQPGRSYAKSSAEKLSSLMTTDGSHFFGSIEGDRRKRYHVHTLSDGKAPEVAERWWKSARGFVALRIVRGAEAGERATSLYVAKYCVKGDGDFVLGGVGWRISR